jgi:phospholipase D-like protein
MLTPKQIDKIIVRNIKLFQKPGVTSVRPGFKATSGKLTHEPAIVVSVVEKKRTVPPKDLLPTKVDGVKVDVRQVSWCEALRTTDPLQYAREMVTVPEGNEPAGMQTATFPLERDPQGKLITPKVSAALAKVAPARAPKTAGPRYQKLPATTLAEITGSFKVTCVASPDDGWPTLKPFLTGVTKTLTVGMYEFTAPHIVQTTTASLAGKKLNLVLDDPPYDTEKREQTESQTQQQLQSTVKNGFDFSWAAEAMDPHSTLKLFPSAYHIKVAVKDSAAVWLSSGNFNSTNLPNLSPLTKPADAAPAANTDRDWHVIIENPKLAAVFEKQVLLRDLSQAQPGQKQAVSKPGTTSGRATGKAIPKFFTAKTFTANMSVQPVLTPDNYVNVILPLIANAKKSFWMQTQYINPSKTFADDVKKPVNSRSILEQLIDALATLQKKGRDIKIILGHHETVSQLEALQMFGNMDATEIRLQENVHNKGMIIDSSITVIGSQNWSTEGVDTNRDASVVIKSADVAQYWEQIFLLDWNSRTRPPELPAN